MFRFLRLLLAIILFVVAIFATLSGINNDPSCAEIASRLLLRNEDNNANGITISMDQQYKPMLVRGTVKPVREWIEHLWRNCTSYSIQWKHSEGKIVVAEEAEFRFIVGLISGIGGVLVFLTVWFPRNPKTPTLSRKYARA